MERRKKIINVIPAKAGIQALFLILCLPLFAETLDDARKAYAQKQYAKAYSMLEPLSQSSADPELFLLLGHTAGKLGKWDAARAAFERSVELNAQFLPAYVQLGFLYEKRKDIEKAKAAWQKVLELAQDERTKKFAQKHLDNLK